MIECYPSFWETCEDSLKVLIMFFLGPAVHQHVINQTHHALLSNQNKNIFAETEKLMFWSYGDTILLVDLCTCVCNRKLTSTYLLIAWIELAKWKYHCHDIYREYYRDSETIMIFVQHCDTLITPVLSRFSAILTSDHFSLTDMSYG